MFLNGSQILLPEAIKLRFLMLYGKLMLSGLRNYCRIFFLTQSAIMIMQKALHQIAEKKYSQKIAADGFKKVISYGIAFYKKDCLVVNKIG